MNEYWEFLADKDEALGPLEQVALRALHHLLEQGGFDVYAAELKDQKVCVVRREDVHTLALTTGRMLGAHPKKETPDTGRYRVMSRPCPLCGKPSYARMVREVLPCRHCGERAAFHRLAGQGAATLLCESCGKTARYTFDTAGDRGAYYRGDVQRSIDRRRYRLKQFKEKAAPPETE